MVRLVVFVAVLCTVSAIRNLPKGNDARQSVVAAAKTGHENITKNDTKFPYWNQPMPNFTSTKNDTNHKNDSFPWWNQEMPNFTAVKNDTNRKNKSFPWWNQPMPNFTAVKNDTKSRKDKAFPWWNQPMPNFTASKNDTNRKNKSFPWWNQPMPNFTAVKNTTNAKQGFLKNLPTEAQKMPLFANLGPFDSKEAACDYCFTSHTRTSVVQNCQCFAYDGSSGPTMFCTGTQSGIQYASSKDGGCQCIQNDQTNMGKTSCKPLA